MRKIPLVSIIVATALTVAAPAQSKTMAEVLAASKPSDWRPLDPANTLYLELDSGRVVIELSPDFSPQLVANLKTLVREKYFDGLAFMRSQDNYVVQWGDARQQRSRGTAQAKLPPAFDRSAQGLPFTVLPDTDTYAPQTGFVGGFPAARDSKADRAWLVHCYGVVGAGREDAAETGNGTELYVVTGHAPRHLDRNNNMVGRVVQGMELLSVMPRGKGNMGFYERPEEHRTPIRSIRLAADVPQERRSHLEVIRTDTLLFQELIESRRNRQEEWFKFQAGRIEVCNVPIPVRQARK